MEPRQRTATGAVETFLVRNGREINALVDELEQIYLRVAASEMSEQEYAFWLRSRIIRRRR